MLTATPQRRASLVIESNTHILGENLYLLNSGMSACQRFSLTDLVDGGGQEQGAMSQTTTRCEVFTQERPVQIPIRSNDTTGVVYKGQYNNCHHHKQNRPTEEVTIAGLTDSRTYRSRPLHH